MKILIASDIHGSAYYTELLIKCFTDSKADLLVLLGDIFNHGPRNPFPQDYAPLKVADLLNSVKDKLMVVKGNCDSEVDIMIAQFDFADFSQIFADGNKISLTHGHKFNIDNMPANAGDIMFYGHFHTGFIKKCGSTIVVNTGSVALPKDDHHSYVLLDNGVINLIDINSGKTLMTSNQL